MERPLARVVDQVAELEALDDAPVLPVVADADATFRHHALIILLLWRVGETADGPLLAQVDRDRVARAVCLAHPVGRGIGVEGEGRLMIFCLAVGLEQFPVFLGEADPLVAEGTLLAVQDGDRLHLAAVGHGEGGLIEGRVGVGLLSVGRIIDLEAGVEVARRVLAMLVPTEVLFQGLQAYQAVAILLCLEAGRTRLVMVSGDVGDRRVEPRLKDAEPEPVGRHVGEAQDPLVADVGRLGHLLPLTIDPGVEGVTFNPFAPDGHGLLDGDTVDGGRFREADGDLTLATVQLDKGVEVVVEQHLIPFGVGQQVGAVGLLDPFTGLFQDIHVGLRETSLTVGRDVEQEDGVAADRPLIDIKDIVGVAALLVRIVAIEPALADRGIGLGRLVVEEFPLVKPLSAAEIQIGQVGKDRHGVGIRLVRDDVPFRVARASALVTAPAGSFPSEDNGVGRQGLDQGFPGVVIVLLPALALGMRAVEPDLIDRPVFGQQLEQLVEKIFVVVVHHELEAGHVGERPALYLPGNRPFGRLAEVAIQAIGALDLVKVGGREVNTQFQSIFPAGFGERFHDVALSALEVGRHDAVGRIAALPEDEAIVVLGGEDHQLHARGLHRLAPLVGVELFQVEYFGIFHAITPFHAGKGVGTEVDEGDKLPLQGRQLIGGRDDVSRLLDDLFFCVARLDRNGVLVRDRIFLGAGAGAQGAQQ